MRKIAALLITLSMLLSLAACGGKPDSNSNSKVHENTGSSETVKKHTAKENKPTKKDNIKFKEITVVDNDECLIKITGIDPDNLWGYTLKAYFENRSADETYMFSVVSAAINGVQTDPFFSTEVSPGKKSNDEINFSDLNFADNKVTDIELNFRVYDSNDWSADDIVNETVNIYPFGEKNAVQYNREIKSDDTVIVDDDNVSVIVTGYREDDIWGYTVDLYLINKTDKELMFSADEASINGFMADPFWATSILPGKCAFSSMSWSYDSLSENDITTVDEIEMVFSINDANDWSADDIFNETIILNP